MTTSPRTDDQNFEAFIRTKPCVAAASGDCGGRIEFCHLKHRGMGGKKVPSIGNGFPGCTNHHTARGDSYHRQGRRWFEERHELKLGLITAYYARIWAGDFLTLAETPPRGAV